LKLHTEDIMDEEREKTLRELSELSEVFNKAMKAIEEEEEAWWENLSEEEQLKALCCVSRRIYKGEIEDGRSYRGVLYDTFGFGPEAYGRAQLAGYLSIHNAIFTAREEEENLRKFCEINGIENADEAISKYIQKQYF
jgi:hypothetical protein